MIAKPFGQQGCWNWIFKTLVFYISPGMVAERTLRFMLTCGLGGTAVVLVAFELFTGIPTFACDSFPAPPTIR